MLNSQKLERKVARIERSDEKENSDNNRKRNSFFIAGFSLAELMVALAVSSVVSLGV